MAVTITYEEATTVQTADEVQAQTIDDLVPLGVTATGWSPTATPRGLIALDARARAHEQSIRAEVVKSVLLVDPELRDPAWLDRILKGYFQVDRLRATKAKHLFTFTNQSATGGPHEIKADRSKEASTFDGVKFRNITGDILQAGVGQFVIIEFEANVAGSSGNIGPGEIFKLTSGAIPGVDISNPPGSQTFVARDDETNRQYYERALARWGSLGAGGHVGAVTFRILTGVETITKLGVRDDNPTGQSSVDVYLANATGPATTAECLAAAAVFGPFEPLGSRGRWRYLPAIANTVTIGAELELDGTNPTALVDAQAALDLLEAQWPMKAGAKLDQALVAGILRGGAFDAYGLPGFHGVSDVNFTAPLSDTILGAEEVLVIVANLTVI